MMYSMNKYTRFEGWLSANGVNCDYVELREYPSLGSDEAERGVHASQYIPPNTTCIKIPRHLLITVSMGKATPIGQSLAAATDLKLFAPNHTYIVLFLLWDQKVNGIHSFFYPYYDILPRTFANMPIQWSQSDLELLEGSELLEQIYDSYDRIEFDYHEILRVIGSQWMHYVGRITLEEFQWARMIITSRAFNIIIEGEPTTALVPLGDMMNHHRPREMSYSFDETQQAMMFTTLQGIPMGSQLYISYGRKSNQQYMLNYGFAVENNFDPDGESPNEVTLELELNKADALYANKLRFWCAAYDENDSVDDDDLNKFNDRMDDDMQVNTSSFRKVGHGDYESNHTDEFDGHEVLEQNDNQLGHIIEDDEDAYIKVIKVCTQDEQTIQELFSLLRFLVCNERELAEILSRADADELEDPMICYEIHTPINIRNELSAMKLLHRIVMHRLEQYPTSLGQNVEDLKDTNTLPFFSIGRNAKIQVAGEQEVLHFLAYWARKALQAIDSSGRMKADTLFQDREGLHPARGKAGIVRYYNDVLGSLVSKSSGLDQESLSCEIDDRSMWTVSVQ